MELNLYFHCDFGAEATTISFILMQTCQKVYWAHYNESSRHQIAYFKATEGLHPPYRAALSEEYSVASFATVLVLSCLHSPGLRCSFCDVVRFCCDLEACNLVTANF
jgi:hypothetical protein